MLLLLVIVVQSSQTVKGHGVVRYRFSRILFVWQSEPECQVFCGLLTNTGLSPGDGPKGLTDSTLCWSLHHSNHGSQSARWQISLQELPLVGRGVPPCQNALNSPQ